MAEVFAGFVSGFFLSLITAPVLAITLLRLRSGNALLAQLLPAGANPLAVTITLQLGLVFVWTGIGIVLGLLLLAMQGLGDSLPGIRNPPYTLLVLSFVLAMAGPMALLFSAWWREIILAALIGFLVFGVLMPYLAVWSKFDGPSPREDAPYIAPMHALAPEWATTIRVVCALWTRCPAGTIPESEFAHTFDS